MNAGGAGSKPGGVGIEDGELGLGQRDPNRVGSWYRSGSVG